MLGSAMENREPYFEEIEGELECFLHNGPYLFINGRCRFLGIIPLMRRRWKIGAGQECVRITIIRLAEQCLLVYESGAGSAGLRLGQGLAPGDHLHPEGETDARDLSSDIAQPDDPKALASQLRTEAPLPSDGPQPGGLPVDAPQP